MDHVAILGADTLVYGNLKETPAELTIRLPDVYHFDAATTLPLSVDSRCRHLFDVHSGRRIGN